MSNKVKILIYLGILAVLFFIISKTTAKEYNFEYSNPTPPNFEVVVLDKQVVSAYSEYDSCHTGESCLMASGKRAYIGAVACPRAYKLGTKVIIEGKTLTCEDTTALEYDGRWDVFYGYGQEAYNQAVNHGIKKLEVLILK